MSQTREALAYVLHQEFVQLLGEVLGAILRHDARVPLLKELLLVGQSVFDLLVVDYVLLGAVYHADDAQLDGNDFPAEQVCGVGSRVH